MWVNIGEKQNNRSDHKRQCRGQTKRALCPKNVSPGQANCTLGVKPMILVVMKVNSQDEEDNEKKADGNAGFEV